MRERQFRRHQALRHMWRRLKEDRNQHYNDLDCPCYSGGKAVARFKEQPKQQCWCCSNPRRGGGMAKGERSLTIQERRAFQPDQA
jgi:hypothetical protein